MHSSSSPSGRRSQQWLPKLMTGNQHAIMICLGRTLSLTSDNEGFAAVRMVADIFIVYVRGSCVLTLRFPPAWTAASGPVRRATTSPRLVKRWWEPPLLALSLVRRQCHLRCQDGSLAKSYPTSVVSMPSDGRLAIISHLCRKIGLFCRESSSPTSAVPMPFNSGHAIRHPLYLFPLPCAYFSGVLHGDVERVIFYGEWAGGGIFEGTSAVSFVDHHGLLPSVRCCFCGMGCCCCC